LTAADGDVLFAVTTNELDLAGPTGQRWAATAAAVGAIASEAAWDAVLRSAQ
jgi:L-aminopeptidase/D-esterase-like protein